MALICASAFAQSRKPFYGHDAERPGARHRIEPSDLPPPFATRSSSQLQIVGRPQGAMPQVPKGFKTEVYSTGYARIRLMRTAPNGDVFASDHGSGDIWVLRGVDASGRCITRKRFAHAGQGPYGIAFYPPGPDPRWVYVANLDNVVRFPYTRGDLESRGAAQVVVDHLPTRGHFTRDVAFSPDAQHMFVAIGSMSNVDDPDRNPGERGRACVWMARPDGTGMRVFASGTRNPSSIVFSPQTGQLWASVIERDGLGDDLVPDYLTHLERDGFYGWPYCYTGSHRDPRLGQQHPELVRVSRTPDVLLQPHGSPLQMMFYPGGNLGRAYRGQIFATLHGSWNRSVPTGSVVVHVFVDASGRPTGEYEDFVTGFYLPDGRVWGRPVGVTAAADGALLV
ncbi:MAG: sorbosone dehydrogenase family protein, partial [Proteobacteria bacterium]|nr:sorbosone dehydrogenase family protein [Pseudomonadota bacterium]